MLRIPILLDSFGQGVNIRQLGAVEIINDGSGSITRGNYKWRVRAKDGRCIREGRIENWPRQAKSAQQLLARVMHEAYGAQNDQDSSGQQ